MTPKPTHLVVDHAVDCSCVDGRVPDANSSDPDATLECGFCWGDGWRWEQLGILVDRGEHPVPGAGGREHRYAIEEQS